MKKLVYFIIVFLLSCSNEHRGLRDGDIVFQISKSSQSRAIELATHSKYSHVGILYIINGQYFVYEAVQPVTLTPWALWVTRGAGGHYAVKRLKNASQVLTPKVLLAMKEEGWKFNNKDYDIYFEWSDERMYCSELVWKIYKRGAGLEITSPRTMKDLDLSAPEVKIKLQERFKDHVPMDEKVVSPGDLFDSDKLVTVFQK